jgi:hypothetical protein
MRLSIDRTEILQAWRALRDGARGDGWRTIPVAHGSGAVRYRAGCHFPEGEEALLVGFTSPSVSFPARLPEGGGFEVTRIQELRDGGGNWIGLCRQPAGDLELFAMMAEDIIVTLAESELGEEVLLHTFLARIAAWQEFMQRSGVRTLGPEAEVGLFGELCVLGDLIESGLPHASLIQAWEGPLDGLHDFRLGSGALEVKSSLASQGFVARIGSIEQLDDTAISPVFVAAVRLALDASGRTLSEQVNLVRNSLGSHPVACSTLGSRLGRAGFYEPFANLYTRRFRRCEVLLLRVTGQFPRLFRGNVVPEVRAAKYELDLGSQLESGVSLSEALIQLGITVPWS